MSRTRGRVGDSVNESASARSGLRSGVAGMGMVRVTAFGPTGNVKFEDGPIKNKVVVEGLNYVRDTSLLGGTSQISTWYLGLTASAPTFASGDTMATDGHAGWTEATTYSEAARQTWTGATTAAGQADNSAAVASYSINGTDTFGGVFMVSNNTKGGATGTLYSGVAFSQNRALASGDTLEVTYTQSFSDAT